MLVWEHREGSLTEYDGPHRVGLFPHQEQGKRSYAWESRQRREILTDRIRPILNVELSQFHHSGFQSRALDLCGNTLPRNCKHLHLFRGREGVSPLFSAKHSGNKVAPDRVKGGTV